MIIQCPVPGFEGEIELADALNYRQLAAYERGMIAANKLLRTNEEAGLAEIRVFVIPGLIECVKAFRLANVPARPTEETFPSTPKKEAGELYVWLLGVIRKKIDGEDSAPN